MLGIISTYAGLRILDPGMEEHVLSATVVRNNVIGVQVYGLAWAVNPHELWFCRWANVWRTGDRLHSQVSEEMPTEYKAW
jgi:hypothetical protein